MKKTLLVTFTGLFMGSASLHAQEGCGTGRYNSEVFPNYTLTSNIVYGSNPAASENLTLDVYQPTGDAIAQRPLIILAHGGSFIGGSSTDDPAVTESCKRFAKMGYVTASINYTLGFDVFPPDSLSAARTVYTVAREMKAAVRFFRKDAATANTYKINPNLIFIGGNSAGAILALHTGYLDQYSELPAGIDTATAGGLEGDQYGNAGYSSEVQAVVNMAGAIGDTTWMQNNTDLPVVSAHGDADQTVPFGDAIITLGGFIQIMPVNGSGVINEFTTDHNMIANLMVFPGDDHCPWNTDALKMTQMIIHTRDFLYPLVCSAAGGTPPVSDFTADQTTIPAGQQVTFTETCTNNPYGFTWTVAPTSGVSFVGGTTASSPDPVVKFNTPGTYTVILNSANNGGSHTVTKTAYITVTANNASLTEELPETGVHLFPNPTGGMLTASLPASAPKTITYTVTESATGRIMLKGSKTHNGYLPLDLSNLSNGIYTLHLQGGDWTETRKVVLNK